MLPTLSNASVLPECVRPTTSRPFHKFTLLIPTFQRYIAELPKIEKVHERILLLVDETDNNNDDV
jgi:hypothetical protein